MDFLRRKNAGSPEFARIAPFAVFVGLTFLQGRLGPTSVFWVYLLKSVVGGWMIWEARPFVQELSWKISWSALITGVLVFIAWVGLEGHYPRLARSESGWNPNTQFGAGSTMAGFYTLVRVVGSSLVVPPVEEIFYRSFLYRYFVKPDFLTIPLARFHTLSFIVTSVIFGLAHPDRWIPGIFCGLAYQWLVISNKRLGDAITAHAVTNLLLGIWVVWKGAWNFW